MGADASKVWKGKLVLSLLIGVKLFCTFFFGWKFFWFYLSSGSDFRLHICEKSSAALGWFFSWFEESSSDELSSSELALSSEFLFCDDLSFSPELASFAIVCRIRAHCRLIIRVKCTLPTQFGKVFTYSEKYIYLLYAYILNIILNLFLLKLWYINFYLCSKQNIPLIELKIFLSIGFLVEFPWAHEFANVFGPTSSLSSNLTIFL